MARTVHLKTVDMQKLAEVLAFQLPNLLNLLNLLNTSAKTSTYFSFISDQ